MRSVGAVILAAGGSSRFGTSKQHVSFRGENFLTRIVRAAKEAGCERVLVVLGEIEFGKSGVEIVRNSEWQRGIGSSIRCGLQRLSAMPMEAAIILACDQPFVDAATIRALIRTYEESGKPIVASHYANTLGIPALFDRSRFESLLALPDDSGAKSVIESDLENVAAIEFEKGAIDIDTPADFERLQSSVVEDE